MPKAIERGSIVQFKLDWGKEPTPANTSIVTRVAKDRSWADVITPFGHKRVKNPDANLKLIDEPLTVYIEGRHPDCPLKPVEKGG